MSLKVKFKFLTNINQDEFTLMKTINSVVPLNIVDCYKGHDSITVHLMSPKDLEKLTSHDAVVKFKENNLHVVPPATYKPDRTVFIPKVRKFISNSPSEFIIKEINANNVANSLIAVGTSISKGNNFKEGDRLNLKVTFQTIEQADKAVKQGFYIGDMFMKPQFIFKEDFIVVPQCFRCFSYEHLANACKAESPTCSICSSSHNYRNCDRKNQVLCSQCGGNHTSTSMACLIRREKIASLKAARDNSNPKKPNSVPSNNNNPGPSDNSNASKQQNRSHPSGAIPRTWSKDNNVKAKNANNNFPDLPNPKVNTWSAPCFQNPAQQIANANGSGSVPQSIPSQLHQSSNNLNDNLKNHEWEIKLNLWKEIAARIAGNDNMKYVEILNAFMEQYGLETITLPQKVVDMINSGKESNNVSDNMNKFNLNNPSKSNTSTPKQVEAIPIVTNEYHDNIDNNNHDDNLRDDFYSQNNNAENISDTASECNQSAFSGITEDDSLSESESQGNETVVENDHCVKVSVTHQTPTGASNSKVNKNVSDSRSYNFRDRSSSTESLVMMGLQKQRKERKKVKVSIINDNK